MTGEDPLLRPGGAAPGGPPLGGEAPNAQTPEHRQTQHVHAQHGYANEVRWQTGQGRQPYANQGEDEAPEPNLGDTFKGGDRGAQAGVNQNQMDQVKGKP